MVLVVLSGCVGEQAVMPADESTVAGSNDGSESSSESTAPVMFTDVVAVEVTGEPGAYTFSVGLLGAETGCDLYADWWEVITVEGELSYRRILTHSHPDEQPFTRSGEPVPVEADEQVIVRGHMNPGGYGGVAFGGSVSAGFVGVEVEVGFGADLEGVEPQPEECAY